MKKRLLCVRTATASVRLHQHSDMVLMQRLTTTRLLVANSHSWDTKLGPQSMATVVTHSRMERQPAHKHCSCQQAASSPPERMFR